jgi:hypothetical protein
VRLGAASIFTAAALLVSCSRGGKGGLYEGVPHSSEYPRSEAELKALLDCEDVHGMRRHAWHVFREMTEPSSADRSVAKWESWYDRAETFPEPGAPPVPHLFRGWLIRAVEPDPEIHLVTPKSLTPPSVVLYNREAHNFILKEKLYLKKTFRCLEESNRTEVPDFPREAIVLKADWELVWPDQETLIGVWDGQRVLPGAETNAPGSLPRQVCVADAESKCGKSGHEFRSVTQFYHIALKDLLEKDRQLLLGSLMSNKLLGENAAPPEYLILTGMHIATREQKDWVWATFWWHDRPNFGAFAEERPTGIAAPWNHYLMQVAYDMDRPREVDGRPHISFNPYIEGFLHDGVVSNCIACHRRATFQSKPDDAMPVALSNGFLTGPQDAETIVVRGAVAAMGSYLDTPFERQLKLSFLWSLKHRSLAEDIPTPCR